MVSARLDPLIDLHFNIFIDCVCLLQFVEIIITLNVNYFKRASVMIIGCQSFKMTKTHYLAVIPIDHSIIALLI